MVIFLVEFIRMKVENQSEGEHVDESTSPL